MYWLRYTGSPVVVERVIQYIIIPYYLRDYPLVILPCVFFELLPYESAIDN